LSDNLLRSLLLDDSGRGRLSNSGAGDGRVYCRLLINNESLWLDCLDILGLIILLLEYDALLLGLLGLGFGFSLGQDRLNIVDGLDKSNKGKE
jgi:hypothetical protein